MKKIPIRIRPLLLCLVLVLTAALSAFGQPAEAADSSFSTSDSFGSFSVVGHDGYITVSGSVMGRLLYMQYPYDLWVLGGGGANDPNSSNYVEKYPHQLYSFNMNIPVGAGEVRVQPLCWNLGAHAWQAWQNVRINVTKPLISFDLQGGSGGTVATSTDWNQANPSITVPTRAGFEFRGYFSGTGGTGKQYYNSTGTSVRNYDITGSTTLYAYWVAHTAGSEVQENYQAPTCTVDGHYDMASYCTNSYEGKVCGVELSRRTVTLDALTHIEETVEENREEPTCTVSGGYDTVVYCRRTGFEEELSRVFTKLDALGHKKGSAVVENLVEASCTEDGSYDSVVYCTVCKAELSRESVVIPVHGHSETEIVNVKVPSVSAAGYTGDTHCLICDEIVETGEELPMLDETSEVTPEELDRMLDEEVELPEEVHQQMYELLEQDLVTTMSILESANSTMDELREQLASGELTEEQYRENVERVEQITQTAVAVTAEKQSSNETAEKIAALVPEELQGPVTEMINALYERLLEELIGENGEGMDLSLTPEELTKVMSAIGTYVEQTVEIALKARDCSGEALLSYLNQVISEISVKSFRDFDKEAADAEFAEDAYRAVLMNMQRQVRSMVTEEYETAKASCVGTAAAQLEERYNSELEAIDDLETFEIMVAEVMRQRYVAILDDKLAAKQLEQSEYDAKTAKAADVEDFLPVFKEIFRAWALQTETDSEMTLEELTTAAINDTRQAIMPDSYQESAETKRKIMMAAVGSMVAAGMGLSLYNIFGKKYVL